MNNVDSSSVILLLALLSLAPIIFVLTTCFIKISMVLILTRESLGVQQIPPNIVIYGLSLILSFYVMGPVYMSTYKQMSDDTTQHQLTPENIIQDFKLAEPTLQKFLSTHSSQNEKAFFYKSLQQFWGKDMLGDITQENLIITIPAFVVDELTKAFKIGFLIYLPSVIIDIIVSNILMAMGMMMMSPVTISLPIKLLLFISVDGWSRLIHLLLGSY